MIDFPSQEVRRLITKWGEEHKSSYPWRSVDEPWLGMLAEILLQRTNAQHVKKYYKEVVGLFPTARSVLTARPSDLSRLEHRFGLDRRIRTVVSAAEYLTERGEFPCEVNELSKIYGIGHYTASAYLSFHANTRALLVDVNIARWLSRMTGLEEQTNLRKKSWVWSLVDSLTPHEEHTLFNYSVLDFTIEICRPRVPNCDVCPVGHLCKHKEKNDGDSG